MKSEEKWKAYCVRVRRVIRNPVNWIRVAEICISLRSFGEGRKDEFRS